MMCKKAGLSLVEMLVVLGIIALLLALFFPAVQAARARARDTVCKNNIYQTNLAMVQYAEVMKRIPPPAEPGKIGGWMVAILPFLERSNLKQIVIEGTPILQVAPAGRMAPPIYRCLVREAIEQRSPDAVGSAHFAMMVGRNRKAFSIVDVPLKFQAPWLSSPELARSQLSQGGGPHQGDYLITQGMSQGVDFMNSLP